jgi:hypothetical protein
MKKEDKTLSEFPAKSFVKCAAIVLQDSKALIEHMMSADNGNEAQGHLLRYIERSYEKLIEFEEVVSGMDALFLIDEINSGNADPALAELARGIVGKDDDTVN